jgi:hypothetical protein
MRPIRSRRPLLAAAATIAVIAGTLIPTAAASAATAVPAGSQTLAQQLVNSGRVSGESEAWAQLVAYSNGTMRSHVVDGKARDCQISPVILGALKTVVDRGFSIKISSLNRFCTGQLTASGPNSYHYRNGGGNAVDISVVNGVVSTGNTAQDRALIASMYTALPGPAGLGQLNCHGSLPVPNGWVQFNDSCNHNHFEYRGSATVSPSAPASFDVNGDGKADILAVSNSAEMTAYMGNGNGGWSQTTLGAGWGSTTTIVHGDYNNDGDGDIVTVKDDGTLWFYEGNGALGFSAAQAGHGWGAMTLVTGGVDFNGDGRADIVARAGDGDLYLYPGNGGGGFGASTKIGNNWSAITALVAGDFSGDGRGDVLARTSGGLLYLYTGNGSGLNAAVQVGNGWNGMTAITGGVDYGTDGKADLFARDSAGDLWLYPGLGTSGFGAPIKVGHGWNVHRLIS